MPGSNLTTTIDPVGRDTNGGTVQLLPPGGAQQRAAGVQRQRPDRRRPRRQRGQAGPERDRLRRSRLAGKGVKPLKVNGVPCAPKQDQVELLKYPLSRYIFLSSRREQPEPGVIKFDRLDAAQQAGRPGDHEGRRRPRVQQGVSSRIARANGSPVASYPLRRSCSRSRRAVRRADGAVADQRVERMLGALVCAVVGLLLAMIVIVFVRGLAVVRPQRPRLVRRRRQRRRAAQRDLTSPARPAPTTSTPSTPGR